jgi:hypothetical protein
VSDLDVLLERMEGIRSSLVGLVSNQLLTGMATIQRQLNELAQVRAAPAPQWEAIAFAMKTRHKSRAALLGAIAAGLIEHRRTNAGNEKAGYLLSVADLDRHFPRIAKQARTTKQKATA